VSIQPRICLPADRYFRDSKNLQDRVPKDSAVLIYTPPLQIDPFDSTDPKPWRMFLLLGMKCIRKLFSAAVISSWIF
jgi:hypothetical protein